ncbi:MAG: hypothetical protein PHW60_15620 [Kiritimatiellae bacterium]|nr:hypothetical protein [Kiritimatiellia bacterium]
MPLNSKKPSRSTWMPYVLPWNDAPLDLSFLYRDEAPAGRHGFLTVRDGRFVFEDGAQARFWGTCFNSAANFPEHGESEKIAQRLAKFGVNLIRTHQMDAEWATPNIFQAARGARRNDSLSFDPESMDRLDYLVHCLKQAGVYIYLDQLTYRRFKPGDGVDAADQLPLAAKPYSNFDPKLIELQKKYSADLWTHVNPYTKLAYKDDPCFALMEMTNENDLLASTPITLEPYRTRFEKQYRSWAARHGIKLPDGVVDFDPAKRTEPIKRFLYETQSGYYRDLLVFLRGIGVKIPVAGGNWNTGTAGLAAFEPCDFCSAHNYWDLSAGINGTNKSRLAEPTHWAQAFGKYRLLDRPFVISEWDAPWPNEWRGENSLWLAALAALQDWSGVAVHTYRYQSHGPVDRLGGIVVGGSPARVNWETFNDPAKFGLFYHAALLFRRRDVSPARQTLAIHLDDEAIFKTKASPNHFAALTPGAEQHKTGMILPGQSVSADLVYNLDESAGKPVKGPVISDTGEYGRDIRKRYAWIDSSRTRAAFGFLGKAGRIRLQGLELKVKTPFAVIAISSLTNDPIHKSANLLLTAVGRADNTGAKYNAAHTVRIELGRAPTLIEVIEAKIALETDQPALKILAINPEGFLTGHIPAKIENGKLTFEIGKVFPSMYYLIQR